MRSKEWPIHEQPWAIEINHIIFSLIFYELTNKVKKNAWQIQDIQFWTYLAKRGSKSNSRNVESYHISLKISSNFTSIAPLTSTVSKQLITCLFHGFLSESNCRNVESYSSFLFNKTYLWIASPPLTKALRRILTSLLEDEPLPWLPLLCWRHTSQN